VKLCMFHPLEHPLERGWVGRIDGDHVVHLAAQTLETYFTGGGTAREHAVYPLEAVRLLPPVLHPPSIRVFDDDTSFTFANPAAVVGPEASVSADGDPLALLPSVAAVIGAEGRVGGFTGFAEWRRQGATPPKDRDFALGLGPVVATPDEVGNEISALVRVDGEERLRSELRFDWAAAGGVAAQGTVLRPGDLLVAPALGVVEPISAEADVEVDVEHVGTLRQGVR
jgi:hypothetical protein